MKTSWRDLATTVLVVAPFTAAQGLVDDQKLQDAVTIDGLLAHTQALEDIAYATSGRNRLIGTLGHNNTVSYIVEQLEALGDYYDIVLQPFSTEVVVKDSASLVLNGVNYSTQALGYSNSISLVDTAVVPVSDVGCSATDFPETVSGAAALISRGTCTFAEKARLAKSAGAVAAIIYNNVDGVVAGTLGGVNDTYAPAAGISLADGQALLAAAGNGTALLASSLVIESEVAIAYSNNVIATTKYVTNTTDILFFGAHSDSVAAGPGINDNGSGSSGILEAAIQLAKGGYTAIPTIKFGWWTAEEEGLLGATAYVASASAAELAAIRLYLNFDMIASPNYVLGVYDGDSSEFPDTAPGPAGSGEAEAVLSAWFTAQGLNHTSSEFDGRSDYGPFLDVGIPCGGLDTGADGVKTEEEAAIYGGTAGIIYDPNYHTAADNVTNLAPEAFEIMGKGIAHAVAYWGGNGFAGFPPRNATSVLKRRDEQLGGRATKQVKPRTYHGHVKVI